MMGSYHAIVTIFFIFMTSSSNLITDSGNFTKTLTNIMDNTIGLNKFRKYLREDVEVALGRVEGSAILTKMMENLRRRLISTEEKLFRMRRTIEDRRGGTVGREWYHICCQQSQIVNQGACIMNTPNVGRGTHPADRDERERMLNRVFRALTREPPALRNVFVSLEEDMVVYPAVCKKLALPTTIQRYRETQGIPKDVVIVLDTSKGMNFDTELQSGTSLFDLERKAVIDILTSLVDYDRVAVVPTTTSYTTGFDCYTKTLTVATRANVNTLNTFLNRHVQPNGSPSLGPALRKAFDILQKDSQDFPIYGRDTIVVLLVGTESEESEEDILSILSEEKARLGRSVALLTALVGKPYDLEKTVKLLHDIAVHDVRNSSAGELTTGRSLLIDGDDKISSLRTTLHDTFSRHGVSADTVTYGTPQIDDLGSEAVIYACLPVHLPYLAGVICTVVGMQNLIEDAVFPVPELSHTYTMLIDGIGKVLLHPLVPLPDKSSTIHKTVLFSDVERAPEAANILQGMMSAGRGQKTFNKTNDFRDGRGPITVQVTYTWSPIPGTNLSICVVTEDTSFMITSLRNVIVPAEVLYHRLDLDWEVAGRRKHPTCLYRGDEVYPTLCTIKLTAAAYESPAQYPGYKDTADSVRLLTQFLAGNAKMNPGLKEIARKIVYMGMDLESTWKENIRKEIYLPISVYIGFTHGVYIRYPGRRLPDSYDHTTKLWYQEALRHSGKLVIVRPRHGTEIYDNVITISQTVIVRYGSRDVNMNTLRTVSTTLGVFAFDVTISHFQDLLSESFEQCKPTRNRCMVVDSTGFLVFHPDYLNSTDSVGVHIVQKEPSIASELINTGVLVRASCSDPAKEEIQKSWQITRDDFNQYFDFHAIEGTNIYVLTVKANGPQESPACSCQEFGPCNLCNCPCVEANRHGRCDSNRPNLYANVSSLPFCVQPKPPPNDEFDTKIPDRNLSENFSSCSAGCRFVRNVGLCHQRGCRWCRGRTDDEGHVLSPSTCSEDVRRCHDPRKIATTEAVTVSSTVQTYTGGDSSGRWSDQTIAIVSALGVVLVVVVAFGTVFSCRHRQCRSRQESSSPTPTIICPYEDDNYAIANLSFVDDSGGEQSPCVPEPQAEEC